MQTWLYHPTLAPDGRLFDNRQLRRDWDALIADGWVDTVRRFPGGIFEGTPFEKGPLPVSSSPEEPAIESYDSPEPEMSIDVPPEPAHPTERKSKEILPEDCDSLDEFLELTELESETPKDIPKRLKEAGLKARMEQYAIAKYNLFVDRRMTIENIKDQILKVEEERA